MNFRLGIVGGGQLGRMMAFDAKKLGFTVTVLDPTPHSPAGQVADEQVVAAYDDDAAVRKLAAAVDFITYDIESAGKGVLAELAENGKPVNPSPSTLEMIRDKLGQHRWLRDAGLPVAEFMDVETNEDIARAGEMFGYPLVLKARFDAYDGRGNVIIKSSDEIATTKQKLEGRKLYAEQWVTFTGELAVVTARSMEGATAVYDVVETVHENNICHMVFAPARVDEGVARKAHELAKQVVGKLAGAGVFAVEMFVAADGEVLVNEIAPRVHNSGHLTIEAAITSQFEQHVRAVTGLPLGDTSLKVPAAVMINILG
ncbi:MAG TPA: 5-(carboxyamino)imidazole ribonucleotide synthase, partial [Candidatus Polarisedimenticolaceae bacterium]|nr:5-(carboxyamino)imidazole ribonucleotide synthase [Candidatus Polarisedimenticolaceae bacterium]